MMRGRVLLSVVALAVASLGAAQAESELIKGLKWRSIGPYRGGRSIAVAGSVQRPKEYYFGATGGGIWKTTDGGEEWSCVSDGFLKTSSVGALAIAPSNPDVIYAGMGEKDIRGNIAGGDGMYKSSDGGKTWAHIGLKECNTISRIIVHPTNPEVAYVAALGHVYVQRDLETGKVTADPNRGIYKTTDGGKSWTRILWKDAVTGGIDVEFDPSNPDTLYAGLWEAWRTPYTMHSGGPHCGIYKSTDAGKTWSMVLGQNKDGKNGWPKEMVGKVGFSVSPVNPKRVYAIVEALDGGIFRSDDAGATWEKTNEDRNWRQRAWYYTHVVADTQNADTMYVLNVGMGRSTDGGKTFRGVSTPHSDNHDMWIAPDDAKRMVQANDGGANVSVDAGANWTEQDIPTAQMYHVSVDNAFPYNVLGAQQDNSTIRIPSRVAGPGIRSTDWTTTAGGESGYVTAKPDNPDIVFGGSYGGYLERLNHRTGKSRNINIWPDNPMGHGAADLVHRIQWTFPIVFSPHDPNTLFTCSQHVMMSTNDGQSWVKLSPDLTRNDKRTMGPSGGPITKDNTSVEYYGTVFTFAESPVQKGLYWAGSDDGLVHVSLDAGKSWQNVTPSGMPKWGLCSMIEPSYTRPGTAFLAVDNHENDDLKPYIYITRDFGKTWTLSVKGIEGEAFARVVREDPKKPGLLYVGTETGVYVSFDDGANWQSLNANLPLTPVHDLVVKNADLVVATHGRGFWILDDVAALRQGWDGKSHRLFRPTDAYMAAFGGGRGGRRGASMPAEPMGQNPPSGILVPYALTAKVESVKFEMLDAKGEVVSTATGGTNPGLQTVAFANPRYPSYRSVPGMIFWAAGAQPIPAPPGEYQVRMTIGSDVQTTPLRLLRDPRAECTDDDLVKRTQFALQIRDRVNEANDAVVRIRALRDQLNAAAKAHPTLAERVGRLVPQISAVEEEIYQVRNRSGQDPLNYPIKLNNRIAALLGVVLGGENRPTDQSIEVFNMLSGLLKVQLDALKKLEGTDLAAINAEIKKLGGKEIG
ncbi:MAG: hypothetical protein IT363_09500 [Methanoregulaceae archaeon]|nr:hypothetical protein [Methanoregulaceae archaeon]